MPVKMRSASLACRLSRGAVVQPGAPIAAAVVGLPVRSVPGLPEEGDPDGGDEQELRRHDGHLSEVRKLLEDPLHVLPFL